MLKVPFGPRIKWIALLLSVALLAASVASAKTRTAEPHKLTSGVVALDVAPFMEAAMAATTDSPVALDYSQAAAAKVQGLTIVRIPGPDYGGAVVQFDDDGRVVEVVTIKNTLHDGEVDSEIYTNGTLTLSMTLDESTGVVKSGWAIKGDERISLDGFDWRDLDGDVSIQGTFWQCFSSCLTGTMALPTWVLGLIGAACGLVCFATAGLGCGVCAAAVLAGYAFEIGFCQAYCE